MAIAVLFWLYYTIIKNLKTEKIMLKKMKMGSNVGDNVFFDGTLKNRFAKSEGCEVSRD